MEWEAGVSTCSFNRRIDNKVSVYSIEKYIQYPLINRNGKNEKLKKSYNKHYRNIKNFETTMNSCLPTNCTT